jgi:hypothetical protein
MQPQQQSAPSTAPLDYAAPAPRGVGAQVWFSAILGIVFMMLGWRFASFLIATISGREFHTGAVWTNGPKAGQEVAYFELSGYTAWSETGIFLFGFAMVLEAIMLATVRRNTPVSRAFVGFALVVTAGMTLFNLIVVGLLFKAGLMPIWSLLVVAFGGYMTMHVWQMFKQMLEMARDAADGARG